MIKKTVLLSLLILALMSCNKSGEKEKECCSAKTNEPTGYPDEIPGTSVYQLGGEWTDQHGNKLTLESFAGNPVIMTMMFTHCEYACPMMINDLKLLENQFSPSERENARFVLISFDHLRDTAERLHEYAQSQGLGDNWVLLHGSADQVKELSVVLNISYELMENGAFSHANRKLILDQSGTIVFAQDGLQAKSEPVASVVKDLLK
jgi:protein SCO1